MGRGGGVTGQGGSRTGSFMRTVLFLFVRILEKYF